MMLLVSGAMTALQNFLTALGAGIDVVAGCEGMSEADLIAAGAPDKTAAQLVRLHSSFFGSTAMTRMQRDAVKAARAAGAKQVLVAGSEKSFANAAEDARPDGYLNMTIDAVAELSRLLNELGA